MSATVTTVRLRDYHDQKTVNLALEQLLAPLGGIEHFVKPGQKVLLKANLLAPATPESAITTHPAIARGVARLVRIAGGICFLGDGPGVGTTRMVADTVGITKAIEREGALITDFTETALFHHQDNLLFKQIPLAKQLQDMDVIISLPKLKTHCQMAYTGALKNQFGLVPGSAKGQYHFRLQDRDRLADLIIDINRTAAVSLAILDAVSAMEGPGPAGGTPRSLGILMAGCDLPAVDAVACAAIGLPLEKVPVSQAAIRGHFGTSDLKAIQIIGVPLEDFAVRDFKLAQAPANIMRILPLPLWMLRWLRKQFAPAPRIDHQKCIRCKRCENGCPVKPAAITPLAPRRKQVDDTRCIRCYCCHEFCPVKAIFLKKSFLSRIIDLPALGNRCSRILGWFRSLGRKQ